MAVKASAAAKPEADVLTEVKRLRDEQQEYLARDLGTGAKAFVLFCTRSVQVWLTNNAMQMASAIAFYSFFSLFPLTLLIILAFNQFTSPDALQQQHLARALGAFIPVQQDVIASSIKAASEAKATTTPLALAGLVWGSTAVFATLRKGINTSWNMHSPRPFLRERIIDLTVTAGAGILFLGLLIATTTLRTVTENETSNVGLFATQLWVSAVSFLTTFLAFSFIYWFLPNKRVRYRDVLFGAFIAALAFEIAKGGFYLYTQSRTSVNVVYGPLTSVAVLLGWLYLSAVIILIGALIAAIYSHLVTLKIISHLDAWTFGLAPWVRQVRALVWRRMQRKPRAL